ncbi:MAG: 16S rRNA (guanine(527)-N(7))-methyltransferase RsmG [Oscillospiraceae bacterium]
MISHQLLIEGAATFGLVLDEKQIAKFDTYGSFMLEYNENVNLTAITDPDEIVIKHFIDSIAPAGLITLKQRASLIDVGTGAGFPGIPLEIMRPDLRVTLLDSLQKRLDFLASLSEQLGQENRLVHARAEQAGANDGLRGHFDYATSRAVAQMATLCEYCLPLVRVGGAMLALKGPDCAGEVAAAATAIRLLGGGVPRLIEYALPRGDGRTLVVISKERPTPARYPRQRVNLSQVPLV